MHTDVGKERQIDKHTHRHSGREAEGCTQMQRDVLAQTRRKRCTHKHMCTEAEEE